MKTDLTFSDLPDPSRFEWDSESDRRDYVRQKLVEACVEAVDQLVEKYAVTSETSEQRVLWLKIVNKLLARIAMDDERRMWFEEAKAAEKKID